MTKRILTLAVLLYASLLLSSTSFDAASKSTELQVNKSLEDALPSRPVVEMSEDVCLEQKEKKPLVLPGERVLLIGDSLAVGMSSGFDSVARDAGYVPRVHAISGTNTRQWIPLLSRDIAELQPKLVIASLGTNDAVAYPAWIEKNADMYSGLVNVADSAGIPLVWIAPPQSRSPKIQSVKEVCELIESTGAAYFDTSSVEIQKSDDQIHFTPASYEKTINAVWLWMASRNYVTSTSAR